MKKVRYALGATAALAPAAVGMAPAAVAHAATDGAANAAGKGKTVSLDHPAAGLALTACTASGQTSIPVNSLIQSFIVFNINKPGFICVGTEEIRRFFKNTNTITVSFSVRYGHNDAMHSKRVLTNRHGNKSSIKTFESGFRFWYPIGSNEAGVQACVKSNFTPWTCMSLRSGHTG